MVWTILHNTDDGIYYLVGFTIELLTDDGILVGFTSEPPTDDVI